MSHTHRLSGHIISEPPAVTIWPKAATSPVGGEVEVHCHVSGHPAPIIKWSKQGQSVQTGGKIIMGYVLHEQFITRHLWLMFTVLDI